MPILKIHIDFDRHPKATAAIRGALEPLRATLCRELAVDVSACQISVINIFGLDDQPQVNTEMFLLPRPERTRERITEVCKLIQKTMSETTGLHVAVRSNMLDPQTYVAVK
ncbi:hypothetical protein [Agrobacterium sp. fls2-241-TYG-188a]|uniref:hypothetical protein n=1 Tax=Agrobacterium sp. fls2-241-TYG-188a TaxID=3040275 RepID=UPI0025516EA1|nr:hypothetical protein [Agrobacterium sp. fls2-241-TYG-188a]